jgi:hypothetical protein
MMSFRLLQRDLENPRRTSRLQEAAAGVQRELSADIVVYAEFDARLGESTVQSDKWLFVFLPVISVINASDRRLNFSLSGPAGACVQTQESVR